MRGYRSAAAGAVLLLIIIAGTVILTDGSETVLREQSIAASDVYSFSFVSQEPDEDNTGRNRVDSDEVYYSDSFFGRSNSAYDHELARASLALSMTAFREKHVLSFMEDLGFENLVSYRYDQNGDEDKAALVMGHKPLKWDMADDNTGYENIIAVAIRGGKYGDEWGSNGRVGYDGEAFGYHYGFHKAAEDAIAQLKEYVADNNLDLDESAIWITGFSRGAAVANVMGAILTGHAAGNDSAEPGAASGSGNHMVTIQSDNLFDYTFASPATVSESLAAEFSGGVYNIVNPLDIVTHLPMNASGISKTSKGKTVRYNWDYTKYGTNLVLPAGSESAQLQVVQLLENALAFATRNESRYVERSQDQVIIPALKKTMGKGADVSKRNIGYVLVDSLPGVTTFLKNEVNQLDLRAQLYVAGILSGKKSVRLEKEHWPETYWGWMVKVDGL